MVTSFLVTWFKSIYYLGKDKKIYFNRGMDTRAARQGHLKAKSEKRREFVNLKYLMKLGFGPCILFRN